MLQRGKTVLQEAQWRGKETEAEGGDEKLSSCLLESPHVSLLSNTGLIVRLSKQQHSLYSVRSAASQ